MPLCTSLIIKDRCVLSAYQILLETAVSTSEETMVVIKNSDHEQQLPLPLDATGAISGNSARPTRSRVKSKGQALLLVALMLSLLVMFVGLAVDVGHLMGSRAKLQSAVDTSTLSAAQMLVASEPVSATVKADQMLEANGIPYNTLARSSVTYPATNQVHMEVEQRVETFFMRIIPAWETVTISAQATADINSYAEINAKPYGVPGIVNELNLMVWGPASRRQNGDAYSPINDRDPNNGGAPVIANPIHSQLPYGYLYRIDVPSSYTNEELVVQIFDPDSYNKPITELPPAWPTPAPPCSPFPCAPPPTPTPVADNFARCNDLNRTGTIPPLWARNASGVWTAQCTVNTFTASPGGTYNASQDDPGMYLGSFPINGQRPRPAFWRVDEYRCPYTGGCTQYTPSNGTQATFTLWHFNPRITSAFGNPQDLSDYFPGGGTIPGPVATYVGPGGDVTEGRKTDLKWYQPPGFRVRLRGGSCGGDCFEREPSPTGGWYFYLYVKGTGGSSENNYDLRVGPPQASFPCTDLTPYATNCYVNNEYYNKMNNPTAPDWNDGAARLFAKRALPLNLNTGAAFPPLLTQVSRLAAGQALGIRHFDMDQGPTPLYYQMQKCGCVDTLDNNCFAHIPGPQGTQSWGFASNNDTWTNSWPAGRGQPDPEKVIIPVEGSAAYNLFFVNSSTGALCSTSWLRIESYPSYSNDTSVWEMPFLRPRLVK